MTEWRARARAAWRNVRAIEAWVDERIARAGRWLIDHRPRTRAHWTLTALAVLLAAFGAVDYLTLPPPITEDRKSVV